MGILNLDLPNTTPTAPAANGRGQTDRKPSEFWLNVGVTLKGAGKPDEAGQPTDLFVNLPNGLPLDDMKPAKVSGTNLEYIQMQQVKNAILEQLQKAGASLQPGQRMQVPLLTVELYRRREDASPTGDVNTNPLLAQFLGLGVAQPGTTE